MIANFHYRRFSTHVTKSYKQFRVFSFNLCLPMFTQASSELWPNFFTSNRLAASFKYFLQNIDKFIILLLSDLISLMFRLLAFQTYCYKQLQIISAFPMKIHANNLNIFRMKFCYWMLSDFLVLRAQKQVKMRRNHQTLLIWWMRRVSNVFYLTYHTSHVTALSIFELTCLLPSMTALQRWFFILVIFWFTSYSFLYLQLA